MGEDRIDPERLAALIDGRISSVERAKVLADLDANDEARELLAEVEGLLEEAGDRQTAQSQERRRFRSVALVAAIGLAASVTLVLVRSTSSADDSSAIEISQMVGTAAPGNAAGLFNWQPAAWDALRAESVNLTTGGRAIRAGARLTDLAYGTAHDTMIATRARRELRELLAPVPASGPIIRLLAEPTSGDVDRAAAAIAGLLGIREVRDGAWLEAARLAVAGRQAAFFFAPGANDSIAVRLGIVHPEGHVPSWERTGALLDSILAARAR